MKMSFVHFANVDLDVKMVFLHFANVDLDVGH